MSTTVKTESLLISNKNSNKRINILLKDTNDNIIYAETIEYNENKHKSCLDIANYISNKFKYKPGLCCNYDETTISNYIYNNAKTNWDFINWEINLDNIDIKEAFKGQADNSITVTMINVPYGLGNTGNFPISELLELLIAIIKTIFWVVRYYKIVKNPYKKLQEKYHINKGFINRTISLGNSWECGFISKDEFEFKKTIEKSIMKKLGYKKKETKWIKVNETYTK